MIISPNSKYIWMGFMGPRIGPIGERSAGTAVTQSQLAATLAELLGEDYAGAVAKDGKPMEGVVARSCNLARR